MSCEEYVNGTVVPAFADAENKASKASRETIDLLSTLQQMEHEFADKNLHPNRFSKMHNDAAEAGAFLAKARHHLTLAHREAQKICDDGGIVVTGGGGGK